MATPAQQPKEVFGDPVLARFIEILVEAREADEEEDLQHHIEAARLVGA